MPCFRWRGEWSRSTLVTQLHPDYWRQKRLIPPNWKKQTRNLIWQPNFSEIFSAKTSLHTWIVSFDMVKFSSRKIEKELDLAAIVSVEQLKFKIVSAQPSLNDPYVSLLIPCSFFNSRIHKSCFFLNF